jgi:transient receptor potential cation channel subfamily A protein 1
VENTPLWLMQKHNRASLLSHPVVESLLFYKHKHFGAYSYLINAFMYLVFLFSLTWFVVRNPVEIGTISGLDSYSLVAQYLVIIFSGFRLFTEVLQMLFDGRKYFDDPVNALEWGVFAFSAAFLIPFWLGDEQTVWQWSCGVVAIYLAWINLILFVRRLDVFGIYVLMFEQTLRTVLKVLLVFALFILGFAFGFHILFQDSYYFNDAGRSIMKTLVMMTGEFEYDDYFPSEIKFRTTPYIFFGLFILMMPIIIMNLLVCDVEGERASFWRLVLAWPGWNSAQQLQLSHLSHPCRLVSPWTTRNAFWRTPA